MDDWSLLTIILLFVATLIFLTGIGITVNELFPSNDTFTTHHQVEFFASNFKMCKKIANDSFTEFCKTVTDFDQCTNARKSMEWLFFGSSNKCIISFEIQSELK